MEKGKQTLIIFCCFIIQLFHFPVVSLSSCFIPQLFHYPFLFYSSVVSNDGMYGNDKKFIAEIHKIISTIAEEILKHLQTLSGSEVYDSFIHVNLRN